MREWAVCVGVSLLVTVVTFWGIGGLFHVWFYVRRRNEAAEWKLQPARWLGREQTRQAFVLGSVNIMMGSIIGGTVAWHISRGGWSMVYLDARRFGLPEEHTH